MSIEAANSMQVPAASSASQPSPVSASDTPRIPTITPTASSETPKPATEAVTGLTPEQVLQELKKSGYLDQLRRQMFDAFTAAAKPPADTPSEPATKSSDAAATTQGPLQASLSAAPSASAAPSNTSTALGASSATAASLPTGTSSTPAASAPSIDVSSKPAFLTSLSAPLRAQVEKEHAQLRFLDARGQQDKLLKLLESEPVPHPHTDTLGDATLYDLLIRHIVQGDTKGQGEGTAGMLHKDGVIGKDANARIGEVIAELTNPAQKEEEEEEGESGDEDDEPASQSQTHPTAAAMEQD